MRLIYQALDNMEMAIREPSLGSCDSVVFFWEGVGTNMWFLDFYRHSDSTRLDIHVFFFCCQTFPTKEAQYLKWTTRRSQGHKHGKESNPTRLRGQVHKALIKYRTSSAAMSGSRTQKANDEDLLDCLEFCINRMNESDSMKMLLWPWNGQFGLVLNSSGSQNYKTSEVTTWICDEMGMKSCFHFW